MSCTIPENKALFTASTISCEEVVQGVYKLVLAISEDLWGKPVAAPESGQFFMLRREPSKVLLCRPISVYSVEKAEGGMFVTFLILKKGQGTQELCSVSVGDSVTGIGPLGNTFPVPEAGSRVAIIGGGIGVAPVAGFASTLPENSYDFYACFRSGSYGLDNIQPEKLVITTDDGSVGTKGMLPSVFDAASAATYGAVYACGPEPMLRYVKSVCAEAGVTCWLSMENRMACGVGACLGCTITTTEGNRRCCKDGPVFDGSVLVFPEKPAAAKPAPAASAAPACQAHGLLAAAARLSGESAAQPDAAPAAPAAQPDLSVTIAGVRFQNPVIAASGTFGYGSEYEQLVDVNALGGICSKGLTLEPRPGNTGNRLVETPSALINSIGLENPGIRHFIENELPSMLGYSAVTLANLSGSSKETYVQGAELLDATDVPVIELNISCPNVKCGGMAFGLNPDTAAEITAAVRAATTKPLVVKLSPNAPDLIGVAHAVRKAGADAISLVNTFQATAINIETGRPVFDNIRAGLSGPGIKPVALRMVYDVCQSMKALPEEERIPVIGLGGISTWQDAVEFIMAGADAVEVGTATFADPACMNRIVDGMKAFMKRKGYASIADMKGLAL